MAADRQIRGVFIGIDRYQAPEINELRYAERDARALHALFADTFGDGAELLVGEQATRAAIEAQFAARAGGHRRFRRGGLFRARQRDA